MSIIDSCENREQLVICDDWIANLYLRDVFNQDDAKFFHQYIIVRLDQMSRCDSIFNKWSHGPIFHTANTGRPGQVVCEEL